MQSAMFPISNLLLQACVNALGTKTVAARAVTGAAFIVYYFRRRKHFGCFSKST